MNTATALINYARSIIEDYRIEKLNVTGISPPFETTVKMVYNPEMKDVYMFVPGVLALVLMLICAMMTAVSLAREKENGTLKILTVSPLRTPQIIIGKVIPYLIIALLDTFVIIGLSVWIFAIPIKGSLLTLFAVCLMFLITALSLGILISSISKTQQVAIFISIITLFLPTTILSGFIYPIENMPLILQGICQVFPAKWFIEAIKAVMIKGSSISAIWIQLTVLAIMTLIFIRLSIVKYSKKG
jgi:ABC-2 type transport system permease protein